MVLFGPAMLGATRATLNRSWGNPVVSGYSEPLHAKHEFSYFSLTISPDLFYFLLFAFVVLEIHPVSDTCKLEAVLIVSPQL